MARNLKLYLDFFNEYPNLIQISEMPRFDGNTISIEQDSKGFARDITFGSENITLKFVSNMFLEPTTEALTLPDGQIVYNLTLGYEWLYEIDKKRGFESRVGLIVYDDDTELILGMLDFQTRKSNDKDYFEFKVIQNDERAKIKRDAETNVNVFSNKDLRGNDIDPIETVSMLLKAKSEYQVSTWKSSGLPATGGYNGRYFKSGATITTLDSYRGVNTANVTLDYGVDNSLSYISLVYASNAGGFLNDENFVYLQALNELTNITVNLTNINAYSSQLKIGEDVAIADEAEALIEFVIQVGLNKDSISQEYVIYSRSFGNTESTITEYYPTSITQTIDNIPQGHRLYIWSRTTGSVEYTGTGADGAADYIVNNDILDMNVSISATSTSEDSIIKGTWYINLWKQLIKSINRRSVIAPHFDVGGQYYYNLAFSNWLIRQLTSKGFNINYNDMRKGLVEFAADCQILSSGDLFIGLYENFFPNKEIASFDALPEYESFSKDYNDRFCVRNINIKDGQYEQDKDSKNTVDAIHTETQLKTPNEGVENKKDIDVPHIRDPYKIGSNQQQNVDTKASTSLSDDDKMSMIEAVELPEGSKGEIERVLLNRVTSGNLEILNNDQSGNGVPFDWTLRGFTVGDTFEILSSTGNNNVGEYTITAFTRTVLTLTPILPTAPSFTGNLFIKAEWLYTDIEYTNRTNEGFDIIENLVDGDNFSNLNYTPRDIVTRWGSYIRTMCTFWGESTIRNVFFKNENFDDLGNKLPNLRKQFQGGAITIQNEDIEVETLALPRVTPYVYSTKIRATTEQVKALTIAMETIDGADIGGFIRFRGNKGEICKGYIEKDSFGIVDEMLTMRIWEKYENEYTTFDTGTGIYKVFINKVGYTQAQLLAVGWYEINVDYVQVFDEKYMGIINPTDFRKIKVNGILYSDIVSFVSAVNSI